MKRYFSYSPESGFERFDTFDEAQKAAQGVIDVCRYCGGPEWPDDVEFVCFGEVLAQSKANAIFGDEGEECCDYVLEALPSADIAAREVKS